MARRLPLMLLLAALVVLTVTSSASAIPPAPPDPVCSPGPADCSAWHTGDVTVFWAAPPLGVTPSGCGPVTISSDTGGTPVTCWWHANDGTGSRATTVNVRRDASPPGVTASPDRGPDHNGWYNRAVSVAFTGEDGTSGIASCTSATYSGPDNGSGVVNGNCTDNAGNRGGVSFYLKYDGTAPSVQAKADRPPDGHGWYRRAVTISFVGSDALSGLASCTAPVVYRGPDARKASLSGTCQDNAANTSPAAGFEIRYDTRPPNLVRVRAEIVKKGVVLRWRASKDSHSFVVIRRPGLRGKKPTTLYTGRAAAFTDRRMKSGVKYHYTVAAYDEAGNVAVKGVLVKPDGSVATSAAPKPAAPKPEVAKPGVTKPAVTKPALTRPAVGARVTAPPLLAWRSVPRATYYNVQLYRNGRKILTAWPSSTSFRLQRSWKYGGRTYRLSPGVYRWYVWPGFGARSATRYGKLLGTRTFVVTR
jgi:hypothetical protein